MIESDYDCIEHNSTIKPLAHTKSIKYGCTLRCFFPLSLSSFLAALDFGGSFCVECSKFAIECDKHVLYCFLVAALKIVNLNRTVLMLAIKMDLFSKLISSPSLPKNILIFILFVLSYSYDAQKMISKEQYSYNNNAIQTSSFIFIVIGNIFGFCFGIPIFIRFSNKLIWYFGIHFTMNSNKIAKTDPNNQRIKWKCRPKIKAIDFWPATWNAFIIVFCFDFGQVLYALQFYYSFALWNYIIRMHLQAMHHTILIGLLLIFGLWFIVRLKKNLIKIYFMFSLQWNICMLLYI